MALTGPPGGAPLMAPAGVVARIVALGQAVGVDALALLGERAAIAGLDRQGDRSCGGTSRLLPAPEGWVAVTLARDEDVEAVPAWIEAMPGGDPWALVAGAVAERPAPDLVERGRMLGLPVAIVGSVVAPRSVGGEADDLIATLPMRASRFGRHPIARTQRPLVVDLSSLWAGPLCARLLGDAGARIVKVESIQRPDGARRGPAAFFDLMHAGHRSVALDLTTRTGTDTLGRLLRAADVVIEASRPRALAHLGLAAEAFLAEEGDGPAVWISITGYGRTGPARDRVAFGDDAAAAGGLVARTDGGPCFVADAVADPLAGIAAAAAARVALEDGRRWLLDVAMASVAAHVAEGAEGERWIAATDVAAAPTAPSIPGRGPHLGEHTAEVLAELAAAGPAFVPLASPERPGAKRPSRSPDAAPPDRSPDSPPRPGAKRPSRSPDAGPAGGADR
jgi:hypothetical protein